MKTTLVAALVLAALLPWAAVAAGPGDAAPAFSLPDASGETLSLDRLRGRVVYVDFWASWCGPCKRSFPWMNEMQQKYGGRGLAIVAVNVDKKRADAERFLQSVPAQFTIVYDPAGVTPAAYAVPGMPTSYLVDAAGRIVYVEQGFRDERRNEIEERIRALVGKGA
jgi:thiol-disulfide isomerase/thioredoxin